MIQTPNILLNKPDFTDVVDISVLNQNFDIIDNKIHEVSTLLDNKIDKNYINKQELLLNEQVKNKMDVVNAYYFKLGNNVFIHIDLNVRSNYAEIGIENGINISELPIGYRPEKTLRVPCFVMNNGVRQIGSMDIYTSGTIHFYSNYPNHTILIGNASFLSNN